MSTLESLRDQLLSFVAPQPYEHFAWSKSLRALDTQEGVYQLKFQLGFYLHDPQHQIRDALLDHLGFSTDSAIVHFQSKVHTHQTQLPQVTVKGVRNIIAISSGKGGVGKTTTAVSIALALKQQGARVGLLDADIYGPNVATMLGCHTLPTLGKEGPFEPVLLHGLQTMSMAYLVDINEPMIWRGPMISKALQQLLHLTQWQDLDYLIVDMPPGTGDIPLTMAQKIPLGGVVTVTIPHEASYADARRSAEMFKKMKIHALGFVENMSSYQCSSCGHEQSLFGAESRSSEYFEQTMLGEVPINVHHSMSWVKQKPLMESSHAEPSMQCIYHNIAASVALNLSLLPRNYSQVFGSVVVE